MQDEKTTPSAISAGPVTPEEGATAPVTPGSPPQDPRRGFWGGFWSEVARQPRGSFARPDDRILIIEVEDESLFQWPTVHITSQAHGKMRALIEACPIEVSWLATCTREGDDVLMDDIFVPGQNCSSCATEVTLDGEAELLAALMAAKHADSIKRLNCWGHSHVNLDVFASGTDEAQTQDFIARAKDMGKDFFVRLIANKYDDLFATLYLFDKGLTLRNVPLRVDPPETEKWRAWAVEEVKTKVRRLRIVRVVSRHVQRSFHPPIVYTDERFFPEPGDTTPNHPLAPRYSGD